MKGKNTMRKLLAAVLAGTMIFSMAACGDTGEAPAADDGGDAAAESSTDDAQVSGSADASQKLVIWTMAADMQQFADKYVESHPDVAIEVVVTAPADYPTKVQ